MISLRLLGFPVEPFVNDVIGETTCRRRWL
jgi:hypothetical protein